MGNIDRFSIFFFVLTYRFFCRDSSVFALMKLIFRICFGFMCTPVSVVTYVVFCFALHLFSSLHVLPFIVLLFSFFSFLPLVKLLTRCISME